MNEIILSAEIMEIDCNKNNKMMKNISFFCDGLNCNAFALFFFVNNERKKNPKTSKIKPLAIVWDISKGF